MHAFEQLRRRIGRTAEPVLHLAVREVRIDVARVHRPAFTHELKHRVGLLPTRGRPLGARRSRVHQRVVLAADEAVVDEEIFFDGQARVAALQVAGAVVGNAVAKGQVLRACGCADRVGLDKAEPAEGARQRRRIEQRAGNGIAAQVGECQRHAAMMPKFARVVPARGRSASINA